MPHQWGVMMAKNNSSETFLGNDRVLYGIILGVITFWLFASSGVTMLVVNIRVVRVTVCDGCMCMLMGMRFATIPREIVRVLMVEVVDVAMGVRDRVMRMHVGMTLGEVQPHAQRHQNCRDPEQQRSVLTKSHNGDNCSQEWSS